jgi:hypothetical protein
LRHSALPGFATLKAGYSNSQNARLGRQADARPAHSGSIAIELPLEQTVTHSRRPLFALILSLLLLAVQLEGQRHALQHVGEALRHSHDHSLVAPNDGACVECTLLAGASSAIAGDSAEAEATAPAQEIAPAAPVSVTPAFSSYYQTRAPPALL